MTFRTLAWTLASSAALTLYAAVSGDPLSRAVKLEVAGPVPITTLRTGDFVDVPEPLKGRCLHIVAVSGECHGCETLIEGRDDAIWLTEEPHPRDRIYPLVVQSRVLWRALGIGAIPAEFVIDQFGRVVYADGPRVGTGPPEGCGE